MSGRLKQIAGFLAGLAFTFWAVSFACAPGTGPAVREAFALPMFAGAAVVALLSIAWRPPERSPK